MREDRTVESKNFVAFVLGFTYKVVEFGCRSLHVIYRRVNSRLILCTEIVAT